MSIVDRLLTAPQYVAPHHALSRLVGWIARIEHPLVRTVLINSFLRAYDVALHEAARPNAGDYASFNDFFTRSLQPDVRPLAGPDTTLICPADGAVSQLGRIDDDRILQAKGRDYSVADLLATDPDVARRYYGGNFATIYLAPHNYHRVHTPLDGRVVDVRYVPGKLFSVNQRTARCVDGLFARNERLIVELDTAHGRIAVILVGAMLVSSMSLTVCDVPAALRRAQGAREVITVPPDGEYGTLARGDELGRFNMGSTVIVLGEPGRWQWAPELTAGAPVMMGQAFGA